MSSEKPYYTKIPTNSNMPFNYCTQFPQNLQSTLVMNICRLLWIQHVYCLLSAYRHGRSGTTLLCPDLTDPAFLRHFIYKSCCPILYTDRISVLSYS